MCKVDRIEGRASYRERISLPPGAVLEVVLEDVSIQDIKATEVARSVSGDPAGPPFTFVIEYDAAAIIPSRQYAVRARILVNGRLWCTSDTFYPVLTGGSGSKADIMMRMVREAEALSIMGGELHFVDGEGTFTEVDTGKRYPIAREGDYDRLEASYRQVATGGPLFVTFEGVIILGGGTVVVKRFIRAWPGHSNERSRSNAELANTYWRIVDLLGQAITTVEGRREPHMLLKEVDGHRRCSATVGCNQLVSGYEQRGESLTFGMAASTLMACGPPLDDWERRLGQVLSGTRRYRIKGATMELFDEAGDSIALLEAVYL